MTKENRARGHPRTTGEQSPRPQRAAAGEPSYKLVEIDLIRTSPLQPRKVCNPDADRELQASIRERGVLFPLLGRSLPDGNVEVIAGDRRARAEREPGSRRYRSASSTPTTRRR